MRVRLALVWLFAFGLCACGGGEDGSESVDAGAQDSGAHDAHAHEPDPEDDELACPATTPAFEAGMTVAGESADADSMTPARISARLISANPSAPRKFENSWVFEFIDAEGQPISDIAVVPDEPWMDVHGHGGGYEPDVVAGEQPGQLAFERINLKMSGPWRLRLNASSERAGISDAIEIHVCVP